GGHDPEKVYAAYKAAVEHTGSPTVILARTIKGYGLGESGEGKNIAHQQKKLNEDELRHFRSRFAIPISDDQVSSTPFYRPPDDSPEMQYLHSRREELGGYVPARGLMAPALKEPPEELFTEFYEGTSGREVSTTMVFVRMLAKLLRDKEIGKLIVPIVPDEARTFGMEAMFRQIGIYSRHGQLYEPVDKATLLYYKEAQDGQILEEGITEAGSMASFIAAGTGPSTHGINTIPFFIYYSMFGLQRVGDLVWAAGDSRSRGFMVGGTAGRTTLSGEGLQHQDGQSHLFAYALPNMLAYDPAFAYEIAVIVQEGIRRMYHEQESVFYYLTVMNENYAMPPMPDGVKEGILKGMYLFKPPELKDAKLHAQLLGSGSILNETLKAQAMLAEKYGVAAGAWSVTSYKELYRDAHAAERWNALHPGEAEKVPYVKSLLAETKGVLVAASDYVKALPDSLARWMPRRLVSLGTDGFGRSDGRSRLRDFFEVDARYITLNTLSALAREGNIKADVVRKAMKDMDINPEKPEPVVS
ncbi:MAG: transketolase-like TK C-terminal-containing protein, partial [Terriglobia bacterium]